MTVEFLASSLFSDTENYGSEVGPLGAPSRGAGGLGFRSAARSACGRAARSARWPSYGGLRMCFLVLSSWLSALLLALFPSDCQRLSCHCFSQSVLCPFRLEPTMSPTGPKQDSCSRRWTPGGNSSWTPTIRQNRSGPTASAGISGVARTGGTIVTMTKPRERCRGN